MICDANEETEEPVPIFGKEDAEPAVMQYKTLMKMTALKRHLPKQTTLLTNLQKQCLVCVSVSPYIGMHAPVFGDIVIKLYHFVQKHFFLPTIISLLLLHI